MSTFLPMSKQQDFMVFWMFIHAGHVYVRLGLSDNFLMTSSECSGHHVKNVQNPYIFPIFIKRIKLLFLADVKVFTYAKDILRSKSNI